MTWICDFGVINCPVCQRTRETIKTMMPNVPDKVIDKAIKEQKIDLHQKVESISIDIMVGGEPKIEIKSKPLDKDRKLKIGMDNTDNPFFNRNRIQDKQFITETNTDPWNIDTDYLWDIGNEVSSGSFIGVPFTTSVKEGDIPYPPPFRIDFGLGGVTLGTELGSPLPSDYRTIGIPGIKPDDNRVNRLVPTSKLYKDTKDNNETEYYRKAGIKTYKASDGKNTMIVDRKSEIQFQ